MSKILLLGFILLIIMNIAAAPTPQPAKQPPLIPPQLIYKLADTGEKVPVQEPIFSWNILSASDVAVLDPVIMWNSVPSSYVASLDFSGDNAPLTDNGTFLTPTPDPTLTAFPSPTLTLFPTLLPTQTPRPLPTLGLSRAPVAKPTKVPAPAGGPIAVYNGRATWFGGDWAYMQRYYKGLAVDKPPSWEVLPRNWQGYGLYGAMPEKWWYHGRWVRVTYHNKHIWVQLLDVVRQGKDTEGFLSQGKIIDLGKETFALFAPLSEGRLENVTVEVY